MPFITWSEALSIKVDELNDQHRLMVEFINELHDAMILAKSPAVTGRVLAALLACTGTHFATEEHLMTANAYPGFEKHTAEHQALLHQLAVLHTAVVAGNISLSSEVLQVLRTWLIDDILGMDSHLGVAVSGRAYSAAD